MFGNKKTFHLQSWESIIWDAVSCKVPGISLDSLFTDINEGQGEDFDGIHSDVLVSGWASVGEPWIEVEYTQTGILITFSGTYYHEGAVSQTFIPSEYGSIVEIVSNYIAENVSRLVASGDC